jgi:hypothetical protein
MAKQKAVEEPEVPEEYEGQLIYNMWVENMTINIAEGGTCILQTGRPKGEVPPNPPNP